MRERVRFIEDIARVASGAVGAATGVRDEVEQAIKLRFERVAADLDLVSREEFDTAMAMAEKARSENQSLKAEMDALTKRLDALEKAAKPAPKTAAKSAAKSAAAKKTTTASKTAKSATATAPKRATTSRAKAKTTDN